MNGTERSLFRDAELVEMLEHDPELLAIADALAATAPGSAATVARRRLSRRRRGRLASVGAVLAVVAAGVGLLISPWQGSPSVVERALAAVGQGPVLHFTVEQTQAAGRTLVDLDTGRTIARPLRTDVWYDGDRALKRAVYTIDGKIVDEELDTSEGGWTTGGPIYTCAWIAAHPAEAAAAGVSCDASGRAAPAERTPYFDPALAGFVDHYRSALASGQAVETGRDEVDGHDVVWLRFSGDGMSEDVAVDAHSYKPLLAREQGGTLTLRVVVAESLPYAPSLFPKPKRVEAQSGGSVAAQTPVTPQRAAAILGRRALWLGESWSGLHLVATTHEERTISYGPGAEAGHVDIVDFTYARGDDQHSKIDIYEASRCVVSVGWTCTPRDPTSPGTVEFFGLISVLLSHGLYVSIWNVPRPQEALAVARALTPLSG
jgi:hypothetical protein